MTHGQVFRVVVCDECGDQYAPEITGEVCACLDREGARHLTEIEAVPLDDSFNGLMRVAEMILDRHYPAEIFNRENPIVGDDPGTQLVVALRACKEAMARG